MARKLLVVGLAVLSLVLSHVEATYAHSLVYTGTGFAISDAAPGGASGAIAVAHTGILTNVSVTITFDPRHTYTGDLIATLSRTGVGFETVDLFTRVGKAGFFFPGDSSDLHGPYTFSDTGGDSTAAALAADGGLGTPRACDAMSCGGSVAPPWSVSWVAARRARFLHPSIRAHEWRGDAPGVKERGTIRGVRLVAWATGVCHAFPNGVLGVPADSRLGVDESLTLRQVLAWLKPARSAARRIATARSSAPTAIHPCASPVPRAPTSRCVAGRARRAVSTSSSTA